MFALSHSNRAIGATAPGVQVRRLPRGSGASERLPATGSDGGCGCL